MERIALDAYEFVNVHADTIEELVNEAEKIRFNPYYKNRLHQPTHPNHQSTHSNNNVVTSESSVSGEQAAQELAAPFPDKLPPASTFNCAKCGTNMNYKEGIVQSGEKSGDKWRGYFCPNGRKEHQGADKHEPKWLK